MALFILVENICRHLDHRHRDESVASTILAAAREVSSELFFTTVIIIVGYLPLFSRMQSVEKKKMFSPMSVITIGLAISRFASYGAAGCAARKALLNTKAGRRGERAWLACVAYRKIPTCSSYCHA